MIEHTDTSSIEALICSNPLMGNPISNVNTPAFPNDYFAKIAEKTCDITNIKYPILDDNVEIKLNFDPPEIDDLIHFVIDIDVSMSSCGEGINMKLCKRIITMIPEKFLLLFC